MHKARNPASQSKLCIGDPKSHLSQSYSDSPQSEQNPYQILKQGKQTIDQLVADGKLNRFSPENTAIARQGPSRPAQIAANHLDFCGKTVLDFGCGKSADAAFFQSLGAQCWVYDPYYFPLIDYASTPQDRVILGINLSDPAGLFDIVTCIYVLNVVVERERAIIANQLLHLIKPLSGKIIVGVREDWNAVKSTWSPFEDGYITPSGTFQTFFHPRHDHGQEKLQRLFPNNRVNIMRRGTCLIS